MNDHRPRVAACACALLGGARLFSEHAAPLRMAPPSRCMSGSTG